MAGVAARANASKALLLNFLFVGITDLRGFLSIGNAMIAAKKNSYLLESFKHYAAAAERARSADWPDDAWRNWRYHRASLARLLAREGMMEDVAGVYDSVRKQYVP
jgi:hypothetical protein